MCIVCDQWQEYQVQTGQAKDQRWQGPSECGFLKTTMSPDVGNPILALLSPVEQSYGSNKMEPKRTKSKASSKESHLAMLIVKTRNPVQTQPLGGVKLSPSVKSPRRNTAKPAQTKLLASNSSPGCEKSSTEAKDSKRATLLKKVTDSALMWSGAGKQEAHSDGSEHRRQEICASKGVQRQQQTQAQVVQHQKGKTKACK